MGKGRGGGWWEEAGRSVQVEGAGGLGHIESGCGGEMGF